MINIANRAEPCRGYLFEMRDLRDSLTTQHDEMVRNRADRDHRLLVEWAMGRVNTVGHVHHTPLG
jgi:hypothetical protein